MYNATELNESYKYLDAFALVADTFGSFDRLPNFVQLHKMHQALRELNERTMSTEASQPKAKSMIARKMPKAESMQQMPARVMWLAGRVTPDMVKVEEGGNMHEETAKEFFEKDFGLDIGDTSDTIRAIGRMLGQRVREFAAAYESATMRYIKALNWGYGGFSPMTLESDYEASMWQVEERLELLESLIYDNLGDEAHSPTGQDTLKAFYRLGNDFEHGLHFLRDRQKLIGDVIPTMFQGFKKQADRYREQGLWTDEEWREYRSALGRIEVLFENRLNEFAAVYDYGEITGMGSLNEERPNKDRKEETPRVKWFNSLTDEQKIIVQRAMGKQWVKVSADGERYEWHFYIQQWRKDKVGIAEKGSTTALEYFVKRLRYYRNVPHKSTDDAFGVKNIASYDKGGKEQPWKEEIDKVFESQE